MLLTNYSWYAFGLVHIVYNIIECCSLKNHEYCIIIFYIKKIDCSRRIEYWNKIWIVLKWATTEWLQNIIENIINIKYNMV